MPHVKCTKNNPARTGKHLWLDSHSPNCGSSKPANRNRHLRSKIYLWGAVAVPDAQAGHYSTKINVHNNTGITINFRKKVIQLKGGQVPIDPQFRRDEKLDPDWAMEVVCRDIYRHLNIPVPPIPPPADALPPPYIEGFVIFEVFYQLLPSSPPVDPLDVEGIYTYRAEPAGTDAVSIDVEVFPVKRNRHPLLPVIADAAQPAASNRPLRRSRP